MQPDDTWARILSEMAGYSVAKHLFKLVHGLGLREDGVTQSLRFVSAFRRFLHREDDFRWIHKKMLMEKPGTGNKAFRVSSFNGKSNTFSPRRHGGTEDATAKRRFKFRVSSFKRQQQHLFTTEDTEAWRKKANTYRKIHNPNCPTRYGRWFCNYAQDASLLPQNRALAASNSCLNCLKLPQIAA
jgi:hypothetical protein